MKITIPFAIQTYHIDKRLSLIFAGILPVLFFLLWPLAVSANGPVPADWLLFSLTNLPKDVVFADLLVQISPEDPKYTRVNKQNLEQTGVSPESEIVLYDDEAFRSFTFHYADAVSYIKVYDQQDEGLAESDTGTGYIEFCKGTEYREFLTQYEDLRTNYSTVKLAFLDSTGSVVSTSETFSLPEISDYHVFLGRIDYDYRTGVTRMGMYDNPWYMLVQIFSILLYTTLSIGIEAIVAFIFGFRGEKLALIVTVNLISQFVMRISYLILIVLSLPHVLSIALLELLVYSTEFLVFAKSQVMKNESSKKILIFAVAANTTSLLVIAMLNGFSA
jgi:hypothetical protein